MIKLSDQAKREYAKFVGSDGKLRVDDTVPEELREVFQYFNDKGINILEMQINDDVEILDESSDGDIDSEEVITEEYDDENFSQETNSLRENENVDLDDLNDLFS